MSNKQDSLLKIQSYLKDNGLNQIILNRAIQTKWTFDQSRGSFPIFARTSPLRV